MRRVLLTAAVAGVLAAAPAGAQLPPAPGTTIAQYDVSVSGTEAYTRTDAYHGESCDEHQGSEVHHQSLAFHTRLPGRMTLVRVPHAGATLSYPIVHKHRRLLLEGTATIDGVINRLDRPCPAAAFTPYVPSFTDCGTKPLPPMEGWLALSGGVLRFTAAPSGGTLPRSRDPFARCELGSVKGDHGEDPGTAPVHSLISDESLSPRVSVPALLAARRTTLRLAVHDEEPFGSANLPVEELVTRDDAVTVRLRRVGRIRRY